MSNKTVTATVVETDILAEAYTRLEQAEEVLDGLQTEQRDNVAAMTAASHARDSSAFFALQKRQNEMAAELHFAKVQVAQARIEVENCRLEKAKAELPDWYARLKAVHEAMAPLEAEKAAIAFQISQREHIKRQHASTKSPLVRQLENLEGEWQRRTMTDNAPSIKSLQGFVR